MARLELSLSNPGMSDLHKVGLGGLYMTLQSLDEKKKKINGFSYSLDDTGVILDFEDDKLGKALEELIKYSFQIDNKGFIYFPALELKENQPIENKLLNHQAILNSFFQHGAHRKKTDIVLNLSNETERPYIIENFSKLESYITQEITTFLMNKMNSFNDSIEVIGWMYPGGAEKHPGSFNNTSKLSESINTIFPLLYAPIGCIYLKIISNNYSLVRKIKTQLIIPPINNLQQFSKIRLQIAKLKGSSISISGKSEAALFVSQQLYLSREYRFRKFDKISLYSMGFFSWDKRPKQKYRTLVSKYNISSQKDFILYDLVEKKFPNKIKMLDEKKDKKGKVIKEKNSFIYTSLSRELFCDNIASQVEFYKDFYKLVIPLKDKQGKIIKDKLGNNIYFIKKDYKELNQMIKELTNDYEGEKIFIKACHIAWKRRLGQLGERSQKEKISFENLYSREFERYRSAFVKSKNAETFREAITDFWSRGGANSELKESWEKILFLLEPSNWKKGRDLALLAIVSYKSEDEKIAKVIESEITEVDKYTQEEGEEE